MPIGDVEQTAGLKKSRIYQGVKDGDFPAPIRLSRRCTRWDSDVVYDWLEKRAGSAATIGGSS